jgi:hypothetical protein
MIPNQVALLRLRQMQLQQVEEVIQTDRKLMVDSVAAALGCSHGLAYSTMYDHLKFQKVCTQWVPRELKGREKLKWSEWVCPCNISYDMQIKEMICLTGLLLGMKHGCIATNPNQSVLQCKGNIPVHLQPNSLRLWVRHQLGRLCLQPRLGP